jgi:hypothetical protein
MGHWGTALWRANMTVARRDPWPFSSRGVWRDMCGFGKETKLAQARRPSDSRHLASLLFAARADAARPQLETARQRLPSNAPWAPTPKHVLI